MPPKGHWAMNVWDNAVVTTRGKGSAVNIKWVGDRDAAQHPTVPRTAPDREGSSPSVDWAEGETLAEPDSTPVVISQLRVHSSLVP